MMILSKPSLAALLLAGVAQAQYLISELSFGYDGRITGKQDGKIPNFNVKGSPVPPEILSNRIVLTPVAPGNQRSSIWSEQSLNHDTWVADVDFRASGTERGGGNLNIWLTSSKGPEDIGTRSAYTVGRFEGLAIVVDTYGGTGGMIRGFLNDGSIDFSSKPALDALVFGQCQYAYRNLGRPSQIKMRQEADNFKVEVDGKLCFESGKIQMPRGYRFGLTAATPDNPDSFEIFKMVVMADKTGQQQQQDKTKQKPKAANKKPAAEKKKEKKDEGEPSQFFQRDDGSAAPADPPLDGDDIPDADAETYTTSRSQFADLHNRLQSVNHHASTIYRTLSRSIQANDKRHDELAKLVSEFRGELRRLEALEGVRNKLENLEREVKSLRTEVSNKMSVSERNMKNVLSDHHASITDNIVQAAPGHGKLILVVVAGQVVLAGFYVWYKKRQNDVPKKYV
ncbi:related to EMP47 Golgi membrane protein [Cephalotrichum gorgonifer]|uniref:Related to EMP47 Golgi membrane protein n=1 Tax=Cephalotrichum gorgonifer TaxID=2041049 RepID=A0AAE8N320_9PEZI|nr:related to EMP47 Golgi membrane protein [Cephalotrichum gorgonifer]